MGGVEKSLATGTRSTVGQCCIERVLPFTSWPVLAFWSTPIVLNGRTCTKSVMRHIKLPWRPYSDLVSILGVKCGVFQALWIGCLQCSLGASIIAFSAFGPLDTVTRAHTCTLTHLKVEELAVASVNALCTAIAPGHFDDVNLEKQKTKMIVTFKLTKQPLLSTSWWSKPPQASLLTHSASNWQCCDSKRVAWGNRQHACQATSAAVAVIIRSHERINGISDYFISQSIYVTSCWSGSHYPIWMQQIWLCCIFKMAALSWQVLP